MGAGASLLSSYSEFRISKSEIPHIGVLDFELRAQMNDLLYYKDDNDKIPVGALLSILDAFKTDIFMLHSWTEDQSPSSSTLSLSSSSSSSALVEDLKQMKRCDQAVNKIHSYLIGKGVTVTNNYMSSADSRDVTLGKNLEFNLTKSRLVIIFISKQSYRAGNLATSQSYETYKQCLAMSFKSKARSFLLPVVLDASLRDPASWDPLIAKHLGNSMYFDLSEDCNNRLLDTLFDQISYKIKFPIAKISNDVLQHIMATISTTASTSSCNSPSKENDTKLIDSLTANSSTSSDKDERLRSKSEEKYGEESGDEVHYSKMSPSRKSEFSSKPLLSEPETNDIFYMAFGCPEASHRFLSEVSKGNSLAELLAISVYIFGTKYIKPNKIAARDLCSKHKSILEETYINCDKNISFARYAYFDKIIEDRALANKWYNLAIQQGFSNYYTQTL